MSRGLAQRLEIALKQAVRELYDVELSEVVSSRPPNPGLGDAAFPLAFDLARAARKAPRKIAEELAEKVSGVEGVERIDVAGPGYLNVYFDRSAYLTDFLEQWTQPSDASEKIIVEHTNINPNKAAHIGHLRNAALGDTFVRALRFNGAEVEVQNYIDDTGVQVADVVVGFVHIEKKSLEQVEAIAKQGRFDYTCWDLYARASDFYSEDRDRLKLREQTLKAIEEQRSPEGPLAAFIAETIVRCHIATMNRIDVRYDLLPWESDILHLKFWDRAYQLLKERQAIRLSEAGKNKGCWVMDLAGNHDSREHDEQDEKVIVRSNGTVTYVGKDIAYQMWKLGLLDRQFGFRRFHRYDDGHTVWSTCETSEAEAPSFGAGDRVYNVIDVRQAYLQDIVQRGVELLASEQARERSRHFSYEMVALTPTTCRELGFPVTDDDASKAYLEVSGRKGLGVKADDLLEALEEKALIEVQTRNENLDETRQRGIATAIAVGALRYFMIKFTKNKVIAFDFAEALSFEGDSGPYLQYAAVRAAKILHKSGISPDSVRDGEPTVPEGLTADFAALPEDEAGEIWSLISSGTELSAVTRAVVRTEEPAHLARFALQLAQKFNGFYHRFHILKEPDATKRRMRLFAVEHFYRQHLAALGLIGIPVPDQM